MHLKIDKSKLKYLQISYIGYSEIDWLIDWLYSFLSLIGNRVAIKTLKNLRVIFLYLRIDSLLLTPEIRLIHKLYNINENQKG